MGRPNILYIHSHDTGRYIQPYGRAVRTPNLQRLADEGVLFRRCFCAGPTCSPSRAAMLTGQSAHSSGMIGLAHRGFRLRDPQEHLANFLARHGYHTALSGVQHEAPYKEVDTLGYAEILGHAGEAEVKAAEFLRGYTGEKPFFLAVGFGETHRQGRWFHNDGPEGDGRHVQPPAPLPDVAAVREDMAAFNASAERLDAKMGVVFDALGQAGLAESTLVIATTDHGIAFPFMKCNLTDHGTGVMLIVRGPGGFAGGQAVDALVSHVDVFPTVCDLAGLDRPAYLQGESMVPLATGQAERIREAAFSEVTYHASYELMRSIRTDRYRYIRRFGDRRGPVLPNCDDSVSKDYLLERGWRDREWPTEALYDLTYDPNEARNVADAPGYAEIREDLRVQLEQWMRDTHDPLLDGDVPAPSGAKVNNPTGLSPKEEPRIAP